MHARSRSKRDPFWGWSLLIGAVASDRRGNFADASLPHADAGVQLWKFSGATK